MLVYFAKIPPSWLYLLTDAGYTRIFHISNSYISQTDTVSQPDTEWDLLETLAKKQNQKLKQDKMVFLNFFLTFKKN